MTRSRCPRWVNCADSSSVGRDLVGPAAHAEGLPWHPTPLVAHGVMDLSARHPRVPTAPSRAVSLQDRSSSPVNFTTSAAFFTGEVRLFTGELHRIPALPDDHQQDCLGRLFTRARGPGLGARARLFLSVSLGSPGPRRGVRRHAVRPASARRVAAPDAALAKLDRAEPIDQRPRGGARRIRSDQRERITAASAPR
jgi:hypothetical protein